MDAFDAMEQLLETCPGLNEELLTDAACRQSKCLYRLSIYTMLALVMLVLGIYWYVKFWNSDLASFSHIQSNISDDCEVWNV